MIREYLELEIFVIAEGNSGVMSNYIIVSSEGRCPCG